MSNYEHLNTPITIRNVTLKNRIIFAPTTMGLKEQDYFQKIGAIAKGGAALIIIGDVPVTKTARLSLYSNRGFDFYQRLTNLIHENGSRASAQLHMSDSNMTSMKKYIPDFLSGKITPDDLRKLLNGTISEYITGMSPLKVCDITDAFGTAALLAKKAGFDMLQIHGDRMCGSFSSSIYNKRTDRYGGTPENRARFAFDAVQSARSAVPDMPIDYKLAIRQESPDYGNAGILFQELPLFIQKLEEAGVDSFHVTLANHGKLTDTIPPLHHPYFKGEGCFLSFCDEVRKYTSLPLCGVGRLSHPDFIETQLAKKRIDLAAMSRQWIADSEWLNKVIENREEEIHYCIACNAACLEGMKLHKGVHCVYDNRP